MIGLKEVMEPERPRVSISTSGPYVYARTLSRLSSVGAVRIRAPLTIDDGDGDGDETNEGVGSGSESNVQNLASGHASSYSKEMDSGTDEEIESGSSDPDDETAEEDADFGGIRAHGPIREDPDAETGESSGFSGRSRVHRSSVGEGNQEMSVNYSSFDEEESESSNEVDGDSESEIGSEPRGVSLKARVVIPRARLSLDDDEVDEILSSEDEDNRLRVAKVPDSSRVKVEDRWLKLGERGVNDEPNCLGSTAGEFISVEEEEIVEMNSSDYGSVSFETIEEKSGDVVPEESDEFSVESEGNFVEAGNGIDETYTQVIDQVAIQGSIIRETGHITDSGTCETNTLMIAVEGSTALEIGEPGSEDAGNMAGEMKDYRENDCEAESEFHTQRSENFLMTNGQHSLNMANQDVIGAVDVFASDSGPTDPKVEQESEKEEKQASVEIERKLSHLDESVSGSNFGSSIETVDEFTDNDEQTSPQINNQVALESDNEVNIFVKVEEGSLLPDKDAEIITSGDCSVITDEEMEIETQIGQLIRDQALREFDEFADTFGRREKPWRSNVVNVSEKLYSGHAMWEKRKEEKERIVNIQILKTNLLRIIRRLGLSGDDSVVTEVLCKLALASGEDRTSQDFYPESDIMKTVQLEAEEPDDLDFSVNVLVLGKTGVGKSATINSVFGETKSPVGAFGLTTKSAKYVVGKVRGVHIRVLDTPGLRSSATEERVNREVLLSITKHTRAFPVDVVLYIDRLDEHSGNTSDIQLFRTITSCLGPSIWQNAIVVLTHAASSVPDSSSYKDFVTQRSFLLCQSIRQAVLELGSVDATMMPRVVLAENKEKLFPEIKTGEFTSLLWRSQLLLLCCSAKTMAETSYLQKNETLMEKSDLFGSPLESLSRFCSLWNMLLHGADPRQFSCLHDDLEGKIGHFLDSQLETVWDEHSKEQLELQTFAVNKQPDDEERRLENGEISKGFEDRTALNRVRTRRRRLRFQVKLGSKGLGIIGVSDLKTGFFTGTGRGSRTYFGVETDEEREGRILLKMRGSMALLGVLPLLMSAFSCVHGGK